MSFLWFSPLKNRNKLHIKFLTNKLQENNDKTPAVANVIQI